MNYLVDLIIRPKRSIYNLNDLGQFAFSYAGQDFKRLDFNKTIKNDKGQKLSTSLWCPLEMTTQELAYSPCIIYCHGNAGNKIDVIDIFDFLHLEYNICSFDFSGAGHSEGNYVTLGFKEYLDIKAVVEFLRKELKIKKIILWGRSMGAVSCLRYAETDPNINAIILDSPFAHFPDLINYILNERFFIPKFLSKYLFGIAREKILSKISDFDIINFIPEQNAANIKVPTILIHGKLDSLVPVHHSTRIFNSISDKTIKKLLEVDGEHNSSRSTKDVAVLRDFIMQFSYDPIVLKEHKRRLLIKNVHNKYILTKGINVNQIISRAKENVKLKEKEKSTQAHTKNEVSISLLLENSMISELSNNLNLKVKSNKFTSKEIEPFKNPVIESRVLNNFNLEKNKKQKSFIKKCHNNKFKKMYKSESSKNNKVNENQEDLMDNISDISAITINQDDSDISCIELCKSTNNSPGNSAERKPKYLESNNRTSFKRMISIKKNKKNRSVCKTVKNKVLSLNNNKDDKFNGNIFTIKNNKIDDDFFNKINYDSIKSENFIENNKNDDIVILNINNNHEIETNEKFHSNEKKIDKNSSDDDLILTKKISSIRRNNSMILDHIHNSEELEQSVIHLQNNSINIGGFNYVSKGYVLNKNRLRSERNTVLGEILHSGNSINIDKVNIIKVDKTSIRKSINLNVNYDLHNDKYNTLLLPPNDNLDDLINFSSDSIKFV